MKKLATYVLLLFLVACASAAKRDAKLQDDIARAWKGRSGAELKANPYLQTLRPDVEIDALTFTRDTQYNSPARCIGIGGCNGMFFTLECKHIFFVKNDVVTGYAANGDCISEMEWLLKRSQSK